MCVNVNLVSFRTGNYSRKGIINQKRKLFFWLLAVYRHLHVAEIQGSPEEQGKWQQPQGFSCDLLRYVDISCDSAFSTFFLDCFLLHLEP